MCGGGSSSGVSELVRDAVDGRTRSSEDLARLGRIGLTVVLLSAVATAAAFSPFLFPATLDEIGPHVTWFSTAAIALVAFAAATSATRWHLASTRTLALAFVAAGLYMLGVLAQFEPERERWLTIQHLVWWAIPLVYALWLRTALYIAFSLRRDDLPTRLHRAMRGVHPSPGAGWRAIPRWEPIVSWSPCAGFLVAGLIAPGWFYTPHTTPEAEAWRHWSYTPALGYKLLAIWGVGLITLGTAVLWLAWFTRAPGQRAGSLERARSAARASSVLLLFVALVLWGATSGRASEPVLDMLVAASAAGFTRAVRWRPRGCLSTRPGRAPRPAGDPH
jgi:hypothetical protein